MSIDTQHVSRPRARRLAAGIALAALVACLAPRGTPTTGATTAERPLALERATQLVVVTTATWDTTGGTLRRYSRDATGAWRAEGARVPVVVGRTGLAWGVGVAPDAAGEPAKREGDGKAPAGVFALATAFGFAPSAAAVGTRLPYLPLVETTECVDDTASAHYNAIVDRARVPRVDWTSSERMRSIGLYRLGVVVDYNAGPPAAGRGSCIFLHVWRGPRSLPPAARRWRSPRSRSSSAGSSRRATRRSCSSPMRRTPVGARRGGCRRRGPTGGSRRALNPRAGGPRRVRG